MGLLAEIEIQGLMSEARYPPPLNDLVVDEVTGYEPPLCSPSKVLAEIAEARARGATVLLVTIESPGGTVDGSFRVYDALRAFSRSGGTVVTYAHGYVASMAPVIVLAGDFVVIDPGAMLFVHSMYGWDPKVVAEANRQVFEVFNARTFETRARLEQWLSFTGGNGTKILPDVAEWNGWADHVATRELAKTWADGFAAGGYVPHRRRQMLDGRAPIAADASPGGGDSRCIGSVVAAKIGAGAIVADKISASEIVVDKLSSPGLSNSNAWPNPTSETAPPASGTHNPNSAEWAGRTADAAAFSGGFVRQLTAAMGGKQILGDTYVSGGPVSDLGASISTLGRMAPANVGDNWWFSARVRHTQGTNSDFIRPWIRFLDKDKKCLQEATMGAVAFVGPAPTAWTLLEGFNANPAPAGTCFVLFLLTVDSANGAVTAQFDQMYCRLMLHGDLIFPLSIAGSRLVDGAVTTAKIADGAVTPAKLSVSAEASMGYQNSTALSTTVSYGIGAHVSVLGAAIYNTTFSMAGKTAVNAATGELQVLAAGTYEVEVTAVYKQTNLSGLPQTQFNLRKNGIIAVNSLGMGGGIAWKSKLTLAANDLLLLDLDDFNSTGSAQVGFYSLSFSVRRVA